VTGGGAVRGKKHCRRWNYQELACHIATVCHQLDTVNYDSKIESGLWGLVSKRMGLANSKQNRDMLYTAWRGNRQQLQVYNFLTRVPSWIDSHVLLSVFMSLTFHIMFTVIH